MTNSKNTNQHTDCVTWSQVRLFAVIVIYIVLVFAVLWMMYWLGYSDGRAAQIMLDTPRKTGSIGCVDKIHSAVFRNGQIISGQIPHCEIDGTIPEDKLPSCDDIQYGTCLTNY